MKKKALTGILVVLLASLLLTAALPAWGNARLTVRNNTTELVIVKLENPNAYYYLRVHPGQKLFSVKEKIYKATIWGCRNKKVIKKLDISGNLKISIPVCNAPKRGTEKRILRVLFTAVTDDDK